MYTFHWSQAALDKLSDREITVEEFEAAVNHPDDVVQSRTSGLPVAVVWEGDGFLYCVYKQHTANDVEPVTAFRREDYYDV